MSNIDNSAVKECIGSIRTAMSQLDDRIGKGEYNVGLLNTLDSNITKLLEFSSISEISRKDIEGLRAYFAKIKTKACKKRIIDEASKQRFESILNRLDDRINKKNDWKDNEVIQAAGDLVKKAGDKAITTVKKTIDNNPNLTLPEYDSPKDYKKGMKNKKLREQNKNLKMLLYIIGGILGVIFLFSGHPILFFIIAIVIVFVIFKFKE